MFPGFQYTLSEMRDLSKSKGCLTDLDRMLLPLYYGLCVQCRHHTRRPAWRHLCGNVLMAFPQGTRLTCSKILFSSRSLPSLRRMLLLDSAKDASYGSFSKYGVHIFSPQGEPSPLQSPENLEGPSCKAKPQIVVSMLFPLSLYNPI